MSDLTSTDEILFRAAARLVHRPSVELVDAVERLDWLTKGLTTPWDEYGFYNSQAGWAAAIERAESDVEDILQEQVSVA